jgi:ribosomal protein L1
VTISNSKYNTPIWLSDWTLKDGRGKLHHMQNIVVKGIDEEDIINNLDTVNKVVNKLKKGRKKGSYKPVKLVLKSQHGFGIDE